MLEDVFQTLRKKYQEIWLNAGKPSEPKQARKKKIFYEVYGFY